MEKLLNALLSQLEIQYEQMQDLEDLVKQLGEAGEFIPLAVLEYWRFQGFAVTHRYDEVPETQVLDRMRAIETVQLLREHVVARIAALSDGAC